MEQGGSRMRAIFFLILALYHHGEARADARARGSKIAVNADLVIGSLYLGIAIYLFIKGI